MCSHIISFLTAVNVDCTVEVPWGYVGILVFGVWDVQLPSFVLVRKFLGRPGLVLKVDYDQWLEIGLVLVILGAGLVLELVSAFVVLGDHLTLVRQSLVGIKESTVLNDQFLRLVLVLEVGQDHLPEVELVLVVAVLRDNLTLVRQSLQP